MRKKYVETENLKSIINKTELLVLETVNTNNSTEKVNASTVMNTKNNQRKI